MLKHLRPNVRVAAAVSCALALLIATVSIAKDKDAPAKRAMGDVLLPLIKAHQGDVAIFIKDLKTGETFEYDADTPMPTASLIKFPVMVAAYDAVENGKLNLDDMLELKAEDKVPGSGILTNHFSPGAKISLRDAIHLMIVYSDNTATNMVLDKLGIPPTRELMAKLGYPETQVHSKTFRRDTSIDLERSKKYGLGSTTAREMAGLAEQVYNGKVVSKDASKKMMAHLFACADKSNVPRDLPRDAKVAHKTGAIEVVRTDGGIIETPHGPIAYCILTNNNKDQRWTNDNEGDVLCAHIGLATYNYFNSKNDASVAPVARTLEMGANGELVVALQRTLNARLKGASIGTDGDFGPETEGAVKKFQAQAGLKETGVVDAATWKALGPLVMEEQPAPEPAVINAESQKKAPPDSLDGPPFVTAKGWAIIDGKTGRFLAGDNENGPREPASTTKIMTAYLVCELAEKDPSVLNEIVTFSERADKTPGSTSEVKAGEKLPVRELLYGLMLPSGNDASVAIGEHFGDRLADKKKNPQDQAKGYDGFIEAMNRKAKQLGMKNTRYKNTDGLPNKEHVTTARDLARLAYEAFKLPLFRKVVATPQHGYTVDSVSGYKRNIVWRNTNQLLKTKGYDGIKTGTTNAAGCCLVSTAERNGKRLIIVVLGSTSSDSRYSDSRNLYRWAWRDLVKPGNHD